MLPRMQIPIEISARHVHLSPTDLESLFGAGYVLRVKSELSQTGEFAAEESIRLIGPRGELKARIVGPLRSRSQVELSQSDARALGVDVPLRLSGDLDRSADLYVVGPNGEAILREAVIVPRRHIHMALTTATEMGIHDGQSVAVKITGERGGILENVIVRTGENFRTSLHLDTDEGNALGIDTGNTSGELVII